MKHALLKIRVYQAFLMLPPSLSSQKHTELCDSDTGWRSLPQGCVGPSGVVELEVG